MVRPLLIGINEYPSNALSACVNNVTDVTFQTRRTANDQRESRRTSRTSPCRR